MKIDKRNIKSIYSRGSCSFCSKGELSKNGMGIEFPYEEVIVIYGNGVEVRN
jgi:hypothetical protein